MKEKKMEKMFNYVNGFSLEEINNIVEVFKNVSFWWILLVYSGFGVLVVVGYMDLGNWIMLIVGGVEYKYMLFSVILFFSLVVMLL